jgi:hypothetical protein
MDGDELVMWFYAGISACPRIQKQGLCHAEFISASRVFNMLQLREILKRVQDDNYQTASSVHAINGTGRECLINYLKWIILC